MSNSHSPDTILQEALDLVEPEERSAYLDKACGSDAALREEIESLLAAHFAADAFMDTLVNPIWKDGMNDKTADADSIPTPEELAEGFPELEIMEMIGRGGMGAVFKARQESLDRFVALKVLPTDWNDSGNFSERFEREAKTLAALNHPNIVTIHEFGERSGRFFFTMEYVDGTDLARMIHSGQLEPELALKLIPQICDAIQFAHDRGVVHRDIKPGNILVDRDGRVKVADFGIAKLGKHRDSEIESDGKDDSHPDLTGTRGVLGTPNYMAPEQAAASGEVDHRSDLYALGVVFYEMLVGSLPAKDGLAIRPSRSGKVERRWDRIVMRALEQDPTRRYQNATEIKNAVELVLAERKKLVPGWLKAVAACVAVAGLAFLLWPKDKPEGPLVNSLGMKFVLVPGISGLVSVYETRVRDFQAFTKATGRLWLRPSFEQTGDHPAVKVSWQDARAFCQWLTERERKQGRLKEGEMYRLPTDREWSAMAHLPVEKGEGPKERDLSQTSLYSWGEEPPVPAGAGNFPDFKARDRFGSATVTGYDDGFPATAPVGSFRPTTDGLYDLGGNVWEWTATAVSEVDARPALRGGGWWASKADDDWKSLLASYRRADVDATESEEWDIGFRVVRGPEAKDAPGDAFFHLIQEGDLAGVGKVISTGIDVNASNKAGQLPIVLAADAGNQEMVELLHSHGAKLSGSDRRGRTPLHAAAEGGHVELTGWLLKNGANARARTVAGQEPLLVAIPRAPIEVLDLLLAAGGPKVLTQTDSVGTVPLTQACLSGLDEKVRWVIDRLSVEQIRAFPEGEISVWPTFMAERDSALLSALLTKADGSLTPEMLENSLAAPINFDKQANFSVILEALGGRALSKTKVRYLGISGVARGRPWAIKEMLASGWDVKADDPDGGESPIHLALKTGADLRAEMLASMSKFNGKALDGWALKLYERQLAKMPPPATREVIRLLAEAGVDLENRDSSKRTPLIAAAMKGNRVAVETLLELGANIEAKDELEFTPLLCAVEKGNLEIVKELERRGADFKAVSKGGLGVLYHVHRNVAMLRHLLAKGLPVDAKSAQGTTPLVALSTEGDEKIVSILLEAGADVNATSGEAESAGNTPLHMACTGEDKDAQKAIDTAAALGGPRAVLNPSAEPEERVRTIKRLLEAGANLNALNKNSYTPLHMAVFNGRLEVAKVLLENGALIDNPVSLTPLVAAAVDGDSPEVLALLLEKKAPIDRRSAYGAYPIHHAAYNGHTEMAKILLDAGADPDARDFSFRTPLHIAASADQREIVDLLWKKGARMDAVDAGNMTAAQFASQMGHAALAIHIEDLSKKNISRPNEPKTSPDTNNEK